MERGIDLRAGLIHQRVSGHREHSDLLVGHIVGDQHDGIGIAADLVRAGQQEGVGLLSPGVAALFHPRRHFLLLGGIRCGGLHLRGWNGYFINTISNHNDSCNCHHSGINAPQDTVLFFQSTFLLFGQGSGLLLLCFPRGQKSMYKCSIHNLPIFGKSLSLTFVLFIIPTHFCIFFSFVQTNTQAPFLLSPAMGPAGVFPRNCRKPLATLSFMCYNKHDFKM